ncbi:hypothetical protein VIGAN_09095300 [Vigna angularis var. angularis]|uniref:Uncharacterized protein n=1 Tax=Vigna angularis var. angularis TaxID=157739 RepID=A0A0S3SX50_PHAAN|nr:hypothetical protein VIGAN_09095300 [Vigna angularis var. angularis]
MKKDIFNVQLVKGPLTDGSHSKQNTNNTDFSHRRKSITIIKATDLSISLSYQTSFKTINFTSRTNLNSINPSTTNRLLTRRKRNKVPSAIVFKCLHQSWLVAIQDDQVPHEHY